ncbi:MAG: PAS domain S-box protein, partial [Hydrogenobacter sp.]
MRVSLKTKILLLFTFVLTVQGISYFHNFYILKQELVKRWKEEANVLVSIMSDKLSSLLEENVNQISTLIAKYERLGLSPEEVLWRLSGDIAGVSEGAFYDTSGRLLAFSSRLKTVPEFEKQLSSLMERVEKVGYYKDSYGELYIRIKVPNFQDNVFKGFYVVSINLNNLLEDVYSLSIQNANLYLLDSSGKTLLSLQHAVSKDTLRATSPVKGTDWTLILEESYQTVLEPAYQFLLRALLFGLLSTAGVGVIVFLVIRRIFKPLDRLKESLLDWNEKRRISLQGSDEIGMLSKTFEELVNRLEKEKEVYMKIFNGSVDGMLLVDKEGKIKRVNKSFLERYSVKEEEVVGKNISQFLEHSSHQTLFIPEALLTIGGKRYVVNICTVPINVEDGEFLLYQIRDITEKKELELILYRTSKLSLAGEIACCIAHQLNNPLASILVYAEYIHDRVQDEKLR